MKTRNATILVDGREFVHGRFTGIGRVLEGLTLAVADSGCTEKLILAVTSPEAVPSILKEKKIIHTREIPPSFLRSEKALSDLSREKVDLLISPYPKLPLFGCLCKTVHTIHDVLDLTHPLYRKRFKVLFDTWRLRKALKKADLTWYDSSWSLEETKRLVKIIGRSPKVRFPGISERFDLKKRENQNQILAKYRLDSGYVLILGNGMPHKNLGVLLDITDEINRDFVFAGVSKKNKQYWKKNIKSERTIWIEHIEEEDLPTILHKAYCLAQPSTIEGYGYPPLEAMACGTPAVVSNIPVLIETTGGNALSAGPDDPKAWLEAFNALEDIDYYRHQVEKGLGWTESLRGPRGWQRHISDIEECIQF